jgi:hypothetical protein
MGPRRSNGGIQPVGSALSKPVEKHSLRNGHPVLLPYSSLLVASRSSLLSFRGGVSEAGVFGLEAGSRVRDRAGERSAGRQVHFPLSRTPRPVGSIKVLRP